MLKVQGNVPDKRLDESLLQPELLLSFIKSFILNLTESQKTKSDKNKHVLELSATTWPEILAGSSLYLWRNPREVFEVAADSVGLFDNGVHAQL